MQSAQEDEPQGDMYPVIEILAEKKDQYKVQWEGEDPATGKLWEPTWIGKKDASEGLVEHWNRKKAKRKRRGRLSKSASSKTKLHVPRASESQTPSTSSLSYKISKPESVLSISSSSSVGSKFHHSNRKPQASSDRTSLPVDEPFGSESSRPRKRRKMEVLPVTPSDDYLQSGYGVTQRKKIVPPNEDPESSQVVCGFPSEISNKGKGKEAAIPEDRARLSGNMASLTITRPADSASVKNSSPSVSSGKSKGSARLSRFVKTSSVEVRAAGDRKSLRLTPKISLLLRREEEENTQGAASTAQQVSGSSTLHTPHINLARTEPFKHKNRPPPSQFRAPTEDISIDPSDFANVTSADFGLCDDSIVDVPQDLSYANEQPPGPDEFQIYTSCTPPRRVPRSNNTGSNDSMGSKIKSRMNGNRSLTRDLLSPTEAGQEGGDHTNKSQSIRTIDKVDGKKDEAGFKVEPPKILRSLPVITPSKFAPYLGQSETPMSSIEDFSPGDDRRTHTKSSRTDRDDIAQEADSPADDLLRQRGLELAKQTATTKRQERKISISTRRPLSSTSVITSNAKNIPTSTDLARHPDSQEHHSTENDLLQEMVDSYVDLSGGYPEEGSVKRGHNAEGGSSDQVGPSIENNRSEEEELPPTDSIQGNTDSQGRSQDSDIGTSQQLEHAINILHEKSEEIESLQNQLLEESARYDALQTAFERLQAEQETLLAQKHVQGDALTEAKDHIKTLTAHVDSLTLRQMAEENKQRLIVDQDKERQQWSEERAKLVHQLEELEERMKDLNTSVVNQMGRQTNSDSEWLQRQATWDHMKESWLGEKNEWLEKENTWRSEKEGLHERVKEYEKETKRLEVAFKSAQSDSELFRDQYTAASSFADSVRAENVELQRKNDELQKQATVAHGQARDGVQLVKEVYQLRAKKLEEELGKTKRLCELLKIRDERTNDEIRCLAALYPELANENTKLKQELKELRDTRGVMTRIVEGQRSRKSESFPDEAVNAGISPESLEYEDIAQFQNSRCVSEERDDSSETYLCHWEWCYAAFNELQELTDHVISCHHYDHMNVSGMDV